MRLPAAPFREWILRMVGRLGTLEALNERTGHDLHKIASGQYATVGLDLVDEVLASQGFHLSDLYPDLYDLDDAEPLPKRRGGWKRPDKWCRYSPEQLRLLYKVHIEQAISINELAKRTYEQLGYSSPGSAGSAISTAWKRLGLKARDRIEMVRLVSTRHGLAPKHGPRPGYKRFKRENGIGWEPPYQPRCEGFKTTPPRQGEPCQRSALIGSEFCFNHDPLRALENQAACARMRARIRRPEMLPMGPFIDWLAGLAAEHGSLRAACRYHGLRYDSACHYRKGEGTDGKPKTEITRSTVERWLEPVGADLDDLYPVRERLAA